MCSVGRVAESSRETERRPRYYNPTNDWIRKDQKVSHDRTSARSAKPKESDSVHDRISS
jgi:hypothetical protein